MKRNKKFIVSASLALSLCMLANQGTVIYAAQPSYTTSVQYQTESFKVNEAFDSSLYYARSILSEDGQKAWDVALDTLLKYDNSDNKYPLVNGNRAVVINYKQLGISIDKQQAEYVQKYLVRQEPRMFHLKDWGATVSLDKNGIVETQTFYIGNGMAEGDSYQQTLLKIDQEANKILANIKDDMTIYQQIQAVQKAFEASVSYSNSGSPGDLRGVFLAKKAICGGYSKGFEYLLLKMGIQGLWVNGYAGGAHAWNYVNVNDKWYLMDTTWGGQNWYLRGEVENHQPYDTYHIMPTLEKEGIPYKWGQYPGVWIATEKSTILTLGETFNALDYIKDIGDIYDADLSDQVKVTYNDVDTQKVGDYTVVYEVQNQVGNKAKSELKVKVIDAKKVLASELTKLSGNLRVQPVSLYLNGKEVPYDNGLFVGEAGSTTYSIEGQNIKYFEANVGINKNVRDNTAYGSYGKVQFEVYADDELIYQSAILGWKDNYEHILVEIPENTKTIKLVNVPKGSGNNHGAWGNPTFFSQDDKVVAEKENLAQLIAFADQIQDTTYVLAETHQESRLKNLQYAREYAKGVMNSNSKDAEEYKQAAAMVLYSIEEVGQTYVVGGTPVQVIKEDLALKAEKENLEQLIAFANQITDISYVLADTHQQDRFDGLVYVNEYAKGIMNSESTNVEEYRQAATMLLYSIEEVGQTYVVGGTPVQAVKEKTELEIEKENLEQIVAFADQINDASYVLATAHQQSRFENLVYAREYAKGVISSNSTNVEEYKQVATMLLYSIEEVGQTYVAGGVPIK